MLPHLILQAVFLILMMLFAASEAAVAALNDTLISDTADKSDKSEKNEKGSKKVKLAKRQSRLTRLARQSVKYSDTLRSGMIALGILAGSHSFYCFAKPVSMLIHKLLPSLTQTPLLALTLLVILFALGFILLLLGVMIPSKLSAKSAPEAAAGLFGFIMSVYCITFPIIRPITLISNGIVRLFGVDPHIKDEVTENEIKMMVDAGTESGSIDASEQEIIKNVFEFDDLSAGEIATHRTDISLLWLEDEAEEWEKVIAASSFSRFPICDGTVDKVVGILNARVYFTLEDKSKESIMKNAVKPAYFVPESAKADLLFKNMKEKREFIAVVLDEYGGTLGIITLNDLVECLIGDFNISGDDEPEEDKKSIEKLDDSTYIIRGTALIAEVEEAVGIEIADTDSQTFSGFVLELNGAIPEDGHEEFEVETDALIIKVFEIRDHMVDSAQMYIKPEAAEDDEDEKDKDKEKEEALSE